MKVAINTCYGGFSLSPEALLELWKRGVNIATPVKDYYGRRMDDDTLLGHKKQLERWREYLQSDKKLHDLFLTVFSPDEQYVIIGGRNIDRSDPRLIQVIEEMGDRANGACAELKIIEIPDGIEWEVEEYDGREHIAEKHATWS